ncbi:MAG: glutamate mutase L, partial [Lachnospiraceae bacterium]|nr:glutamate mutase L [Lachnospiraceae bacterium]
QCSERKNFILFSFHKNDFKNERIVKLIDKRIDFGSTFIKVVLADIEKREVILSDKFPSTVHTDARIGLEHCFQAVKKVLSEEQFHQALKLSSSSAAGGLRMAVVGLTRTLSITAGRDAVFGAGAKVMGTFHGELDDEKLKELEQLDLEILLLCGGYENGNTTMVLHNAKRIAESKIRVPIVYSGNNQVAKQIRFLMSSHKKECFIIDNILPEVGVVHVEPSQEIIRHLFMQRITNMKGLSAVKESLGEILMPTPAAVLAAGELLSGGTKTKEGMGPLMMVDVGGATTDIYSFIINKGYDGAKIAGSLEPFGKRTVEGDMGMRESSVCLYNEMDVKTLAEKAKVSEEQWKAGIEKRITNTSYLTDSEEEYRIDQTIAKSAVRISARRHAGKLEDTYYGSCERVQRGKNLTDIKTVIGTGGPIINSRHPELILKQVEKNSQTDRDILLPKKVETYIDREYVFFAAGLLKDYDEEAAYEQMTKSITKVEDDKTRR